MGLENSQLRKVREHMVRVNEVINNAEKGNQWSFFPSYDIRSTVLSNKTLNLQINV